MPTIPFRTVRPIDEILSVVGAIIDAVERGSLDDVFDNYERLVSALGRKMTDADSIRSLPPWSAVDFKVRIAAVCLALRPGLSHANESDSEKHWRTTDAFIRGFARAEATFHRNLARQIRSRDLSSDVNPNVVALRHDQLADKYHALSTREGWQ